MTTASGEGLPNVVGGSNESDYIIAPEVTEITFRYYDGTSWTADWDSTWKEADDATPVGPPRAIAVEFEIKTAHSENTPTAVKKFRHVIAIPTASGIQTSPTR